MGISNVEEFNNNLKDNNLTIVCAESITAGLLASTIASVSGASSVLKGSIVTYNAELKMCILDVDPRVLDEHTAESIETTVEMVCGLMKVYPSASIHVAITGVASVPTNDYKLDKEVGQIYVAIHYNNHLYKFDKIIKDTDRNQIREKAVQFILNSVTEIIANEKKVK